MHILRSYPPTQKWCCIDYQRKPTKNKQDDGSLRTSLTRWPSPLESCRACRAAAWGIMTFKAAVTPPERNTTRLAETEYVSPR